MLRLVVYPQAPPEAWAELFRAYTSMAKRNALPDLQRSIVRRPRMDMPFVIWIVHAPIGPVGEVSIYNIDFANRCAELGVLAAVDAPKIRIARAVLSACTTAFYALNLIRLEAYVRVDNPHVCDLARRFGFAEEGALRRAAAGVDVAVFGLLRSEFEARWGERLGGRASLDHRRRNGL